MISLETGTENPILVVEKRKKHLMVSGLK